MEEDKRPGGIGNPMMSDDWQTLASHAAHTRQLNLGPEVVPLVSDPLMFIKIWEKKSFWCLRTLLFCFFFLVWNLFLSLSLEVNLYAIREQYEKILLECCVTHHSINTNRTEV